jgi:ACS family hexuronate transporter-like MFS transporter
MPKQHFLLKNKLKLFNPLFAQTVAAFGVLTIPPLASFILHDLGISTFKMGLMMSSFYLGCIIFSFFTGQIINYLGIQKSMVVSLVIIGVFIMLSTLTSSIWLIILSLTIAGVGYSLINPTINLLITQDFPKDIRGLVMSIKQMGVTLGGVLTALVLPNIAALSHWRFSLFIGGAFVFCSSLYFFLILRDYERSSKDTDPGNQNLLHNLKVFFNNPRLVRLSLLSFFFVGAQFSYFMYLILYLHLDLLYSIVIASTLLALSQGTGTVGRVVWGIASDRVGDRNKVLTMIGILSALFLVILSLSSFITFPLFVLVIITMSLGFTISGWNGVFQAAIIEYGGEKSAAVSSGVSLTFTYMGIYIFPLIFGWSKDIFSSFSVSWIFVSICLIFSTFLINEPVKGRRKAFSPNL